MDNYRLERDFQAYCESMVREVEEKEAYIDTLKSDIASLEGRNSDLEGEIERLKYVIEGLDSEITNLHNEINEKSKAEEQVQY